MTTPTRVTGPGIYNIPTDDYHRDPVPGRSLSSSGARYLLDNCPAKFDHWRNTDGEHKTAWDEGTAAHKLVLGVGPELIKVEGRGKGGVDTWTTNADKDDVANARLRGQVPLKPRQWDMVHAMAAALHRHRLASALLNPEAGVAEQTIVWQDPATGTMLRALIDQLRHPAPYGQMYYVPDYKTATSANPAHVERAVSDWGYHIQGWWYETAVKAAGRAGADVQFALVVQEKTPPYLVSVCFPDAESIRAGGQLARDAINQYTDCAAANSWPGYPETGVPVALPPWELAKAGATEW